MDDNFSVLLARATAEVATLALAAEDLVEAIDTLVLVPVFV